MVGKLLRKVKGMPPGRGTVLAHSTDTPGMLEFNAEEDVSRSVAVFEAAGWTVIRSVPPVSNTRPLVATLPAVPIALLLVAVLRERPAQMPGIAFGPPPGWSPSTRRLLHVWTADAALPEALSL